VNGIAIVRDADADTGQLLPESYRPRTGGKGGSGQLPDPLGKRLRPVYAGLPDPLAAVGVERGERLAAPAVEDRQPLARRAGLADRATERVQGAHSRRREPQPGAESLRGRDPNPQAGEGARSEPDGEEVDAAPAARRRGEEFDLGQQSGRVARPALGREAQLRLLDDLAVAPGAGDGVERGGVEADDYQGGRLDGLDG